MKTIYLLRFREDERANHLAECNLSYCHKDIRFENPPTREQALIALATYPYICQAIRSLPKWLEPLKLDMSNYSLGCVDSKYQAKFNVLVILDNHSYPLSGLIQLFEEELY